MDRVRARRTLRPLALGHLAVMVATVAVAARLASLAAAAAPDSPFGLLLALPTALAFAGALLAAVGQILSVRKLRALAGAATEQVTVDQITRSLRRSVLCVALGLYVLALGLPFLYTEAAWPVLSASLALLTLAPFLLEYSFAGWLHRLLNPRAEYSDPATSERLPPGIGPRLRRAQPLVAGAFGVLAALLLVTTVSIGSRSTSSAVHATLDPIVAATAATAVPLLFIRPVLLVRAAITGDTVRLSALRRAGTSFVRAGTAAAAPTALVIASIPATPVNATITGALCTVLAHVLFAATLQFLAVSNIQIGDLPKRWHRAAGRTRRARPPRRSRQGRPRGEKSAVGGSESGRAGFDHTHPTVDRSAGTTLLACALAGTAAATVGLGIILGTVVLEPSSSVGHFVVSVVVVWIVLLPGAVVFTGLLLGYLSLRRQDDRRRAGHDAGSTGRAGRAGRAGGRQDVGMAQVTARTERTINAPAERVRAALADYETVRPTILTDHYRDYRVEAGGQGAGSRVHWMLQATKKRVRDQLVEVSEPGEGRIVERDSNSSMVTTWTVTAEGEDRSVVAVESTWNGASGIGGFFERTFAPKGLSRIHDGVLANLAGTVHG